MVYADEAPDPRAEQAEKLFREGKKLIEIAETLGVPEGTVRSWKNRYNWMINQMQRCKTRNANVAKKINTKNKAAEDAVNQVMENTDLTDKQRLFCVLYVRSFNATKAYQKAYRCSYETAMVEGWNTLRNP